MNNTEGSQAAALPLPDPHGDVLDNNYLKRFDKDLDVALKKLTQDIAEGFSANQISAHFEMFKSNLNEVFGGKSQQAAAHNIPPAPENLSVLEPHPDLPSALHHSYVPTDSFEYLPPLQHPSEIQSKLDRSHNTRSASDHGDHSSEGERRSTRSDADSKASFI